MVTYFAVYRNPATGDVVKIHALTKDMVPLYRTFRGSGGKRRYKRIHVKATRRKVIIVAKSSRTKGRKKSDIVDDELEELEEMEDLDELDELENEEEPDDEEDEDEEDDEDEDEDDEEDEEPAPKAKRSRSTRAKKASTSKKSVSRNARTDGTVGVEDLAQATGKDARGIRQFLRKNNVDKNEDTARYEWPSTSNREFKSLVAQIKKGGVDRVKKESLDNLKNRKKTGAARSKTPAKKRRTRS